MNLRDLGWNAHFEKHFEPFCGSRFQPGRIASENHEIYKVHTVHGLFMGELAGRLRFMAGGEADLPAVGDWAVVETFPKDETAIIHEVLPRQTAVVRRSPGTGIDVQILASNIDAVFILAAPLPELNCRRLERYLALVREGGAGPVIVISKADLVADLYGVMTTARKLAGGAPVILVSSLTGAGLPELRRYTGVSRTVALLGPSGSGKSTLINALVGETVQQTSEIRADGRGRHTTTSRDLIPLPGGGLLIDTPGLREAGLTSDGETLESAFEDVAVLSESCRFRDCRHQQEPACAVKAAVLNGVLDSGRLESFSKLQREAAFAELRQTSTASYAEKTRWKGVMKELKKKTKTTSKR